MLDVVANGLFVVVVVSTSRYRNRYIFIHDDDNKFLTQELLSLSLYLNGFNSGNF
jgi:hypothetical protein